MSELTVPVGFSPISCADFLARYPALIADVAPTFPTLTEGEVREAIERMAAGIPGAQDPVLRFALGLDGDPAVFTAERGRFTVIPMHLDISDAVVAWFASTGSYDASDGRMVPEGYEPFSVDQWWAESQREVRAIATDARLSMSVVAEIVFRLAKRGELWIERKIDRQPGDGDRVRLRVRSVEALTRSERQFAEALERRFTTEHYGKIRFSESPPIPSTEKQMKQIQMVRTPSGPLALVRQTAEKLLAEGAISGTLDGDLHAADAATVKAAIMASAICDFCSAPGAVHYFDVPDFGITKNDDPNNYGAAKSTGGWMACDTCDDLVRADKRKQLIDRAIETMAFPKFSRRAIEELYAKFWHGMDARVAAAGAGAVLANYVEDRFDPGIRSSVETDRDLRIAGVMRMTGLTRNEVDDLLAGKLSRDAVAKIAEFERQAGRIRDPRALIDKFVNGPHAPLKDIIPHWQRALDMRFAALSSLAGLLKTGTHEQIFPESVDLNDAGAVSKLVKIAQARKTLREMGFGEDLKYLRAAQAYSFNADTIAAIREAAKSLPHEAPLSSIETPNTGAGWFWFGDPLPVTASPIASDRTHALLWGWTEGPSRKVYTVTIDDETIARVSSPDDVALLRRLATPNGFAMTDEDVDRVGSILRGVGLTQSQLDRCTHVTEERGEPSLMFSAYVLDEHGSVSKQIVPQPSTRWYWPLSMSFHDLIAFSARQWDETYGPGTPLAEDTNVSGKDATLRCIGELSLFFLMSCLWFKQTVPASGGAPKKPVLTREPGQVERHARKRYAKEHQLAEPPTVQVVALRKSERVPAEDAPVERRDGAREYHCRWVVAGHPRLQACGPQRKDRKLIWIDGYVKGPDDKPLRTRDKVYAVIR